MNGTGPPDIDVLMVLLIGVVIVAAMLIQALALRWNRPALVGFVLLGIALQLGNEVIPILSPSVRGVFQVLASLGVVALLFRVGLHAHPRALLAKLPAAVPIWVGNVLVSGLVGYATARWLLGQELIPSLVVAVALTATSIGVAMPLWEDARRLNSASGTLTMDVAELDDISGVLLMAVLFALLPVLRGGEGDLLGTSAGVLADLAVRFAGFTVCCWLFAHYAQPRISSAVMRWEKTPTSVLTIAGLGAVIAAIAGWLGFSLAIGALFAGLAFSGAPDRVRSDPAYRVLHDFLAPFFFIGIGLTVDPAALTTALPAGLLLLAAAVAGKFVGAWLPARPQLEAAAALAVAVSMIPRAEIAMVIMHQGHQLGAWAVPERLYAAMTVVVLGTCLITPAWLAQAVRRIPA